MNKKQLIIKGFLFKILLLLGDSSLLITLIVWFVSETFFESLGCPFDLIFQQILIRVFNFNKFPLHQVNVKLVEDFFHFGETVVNYPTMPIASNLILGFFVSLGIVIDVI